MAMAMAMAMAFIVKFLVGIAVLPVFSEAVNIMHLRELAARHNVTCLIAFGDSSLDAGNNNHLQTTSKCNFPPYGKNLLGASKPTGRFSDGRLASDFIVEALGYAKLLPAFLDTNLKPLDMVHGVTFASGGSGYDDLTANISKVLPLSKQLEYFLHYKIDLKQAVGENKATSIIENAFFLLSMGTNDFLQNYYIDPTRPKQFSLEQYENFLVSQMAHDIQVMHKLGARRLAVVGVPPIGCMPLVKTILNQKSCVESYNRAVYSFNTKVQAKLAHLGSTLGMATAFLDVYRIIMDAITHPSKYGFSETSKGCCGTGTVEYAVSCEGMDTCAEPSKYVFWDAVHPSEKMYSVIAEKALEIVPKILE